MGLDYCESCGALEQGFRDATDEECIAVGVDPETGGDENQVCECCGEVGSRVDVPEHDDYDMER
jgi:hypothetical protein